MDINERDEQQDIERAEQEGMVPQNQEGAEVQSDEERARLEAELEQAKSEAEEAESDAAQAEAESVENPPAMRPSRAGTRQSEADPEYHFDSRNIVSTYGEWAVTHQGMANLTYPIFISADMLRLYTKENIESRYPYANADQFRRVQNDAIEHHFPDESE